MSGELVPIDAPRQLVKNAAVAAESCRELLASCIVEIRQGGQTSRHLRVEGWSMLLAAHGLMPGCDEPQRVENADGGLIGYRCRGWIRDNQGRELGAAYGMVSTDERNWRNKPEFQLASMAQTRAVAKAARLCLGHVVALLKLPGLMATPAEEMEIDHEPQQAPSQSQPLPGPSPTGRGISAPATAKQLGMISSLVNRLKATSPELGTELRNRFGDAANLDRESASAIISELQDMMGQTNEGR
jgi:hypothetical protein